MTVTESLKRFRKEKKVIQKEIAEYLGMKTQMYQYYESNGGLSAENLKKIVEKYKVSADYLLGLEDNPCREKVETTDKKESEMTLDERVARLEKLLAAK